jgi:hypothetical protein
VNSAEAGTFASAPFVIDRPSRIEFVLLNEFEGPTCRRSVRIENFGIVAATGGAQ